MPGLYRYTPVARHELPNLLQTGLSEKRTWYDSLKTARQTHKNLQLLVVPAKAVRKGSVPPERILNANPYRPPTAIHAGGGILVRPGPEIAMIYRRGVWDLPKGKRDPGESKRACAVREVQEELGIDDVEVLSRLPKSVHAYATRRRFLIKTTYWYAMRTNAVTFRPERREGIHAVAWTPFDLALERVGFETLRTLLRKSETALREAAGS